VNRKKIIPVLVTERKTLAIIDNGAGVSCLSANFVQKCNIYVTKISFKRQPLFTADGRTLGVVGHANVYIDLADYKILHQFYVVKKLNHCVFGINFYCM